MRELEFRTTRVRRGWLERLKGYERAYETKLTDGERVAWQGTNPRSLAAVGTKKLGPGVEVES